MLCAPGPTLAGRQPAAEDFRIAVTPIVGQVVGVLVEQLASLCVDTSRIRTEPLQRIENADTRMSVLQLCDDRAKLRLPGGAQRFLSAFSGISPHFRPRRHRLTAAGYRHEMDTRFTAWNEVVGVPAAA